MNRTLTVGITTRDRPDALAACLKSVRVIAHLNPEIIVFDDGSKEDVRTLALMAGVAARVIRDESSPGTAAGRNRMVCGPRLTRRSYLYEVRCVIAA